jgi:hypothetical protein
MSRDGRKTGGRKKGSVNKINNDLREKISEFLEGEFDNVIKAFKDKNLVARDKIKLYCELLQYSLPKYQATSLDIPFDKMTEEQLDQIIERLMQVHPQLKIA